LNRKNCVILFREQVYILKLLQIINIIKMMISSAEIQL